MKKHFQSYVTVLMLAVMSLFVVSCGDDDPIAKPEPTFERRTITHTCYGGSSSIDIYNCDDNTSVYCLESWVTVELQGSSVFVEIGKNSSSSERTAILHLDHYGATVDRISITQEGNRNNNDSDKNDGNSNDDDDGELSAPTGMSLSKNGCSITLSWNKVPKAQQYRVEFSNPYGFNSGSFVYKASTSETTFTMDCKIAGNWGFRVRAQNGNDFSDYSETVTTYIYESDYKDNDSNNGETSSKPAKPTGLRADVNGNNVSVSWNASKGASYYRLYYVKPAPYDIESFDNVYETSTTMTCTITGTWTIWVEAVGADYESSEPSAKVQFTISKSSGGGNNGGGNNGGNGGSNKPSQLDAPTNLEVLSRPSDSFVLIQFEGVDLGYDYHLYRSTSPNSGYTKITASMGYGSGKIVYFTDQNPRSGTSYYKIKAVGLDYLGIKDSEFSDYVKVTR